MAGVNPLGGSLPKVGEGAGANAGASGSSMLSCGLMGSPFREAASHRFGGLANDARPGALGSLAAAAVLKWSRAVASFRGCAGGATGNCGWESFSETGNNGASVGGVLALVSMSAVGRGSDSLETAGVGADSFNSTDSSRENNF
jgi:hypothetical protein